MVELEIERVRPIPEERRTPEICEGEDEVVGGGEGLEAGVVGVRADGAQTRYLQERFSSQRLIKNNEKQIPCIVS